MDPSHTLIHFLQQQLGGDQECSCQTHRWGHMHIPCSGMSPLCHLFLLWLEAIPVWTLEWLAWPKTKKKENVMACNLFPQRNMFSFANENLHLTFQHSLSCHQTILHTGPSVLLLVPSHGSFFPSSLCSKPAAPAQMFSFASSLNINHSKPSNLRSNRQLSQQRDISGKCVGVGASRPCLCYVILDN